MLRSLEVENFPAFLEARPDFADGLNVIVGRNGTGTTHLLKLPYAATAVSAEEGWKRNGQRPTEALPRTRIAEKLAKVFRPDDRLGRLAPQQKGRSRCEVKLRLSESETSIAFNFASQDKSEVAIDPGLIFVRDSSNGIKELHLYVSRPPNRKIRPDKSSGINTLYEHGAGSRQEQRSALAIDRSPSAWCETAPVFLPTLEPLTVYRRFAPLCETHRPEFEDKWRDTCYLPGSLAMKGVHEPPAEEISSRMFVP